MACYTASEVVDLLEMEGDIPEPMLTDSDDDLGLDISEDEERLVHCTNEHLNCNYYYMYKSYL